MNCLREQINKSLKMIRDKFPLATMEEYEENCSIVIANQVIGFETAMKMFAPDYDYRDFSDWLMKNHIYYSMNESFVAPCKFGSKDSLWFITQKYGRNIK